MGSAFETSDSIRDLIQTCRYQECPNILVEVFRWPLKEEDNSSFVTSTWIHLVLSCWP